MGFVRKVAHSGIYKYLVVCRRNIHEKFHLTETEMRVHLLQLLEFI